MRTIDFSPLYRSSVGFDQLANRLESALRTEPNNGYPPYNIEVVDENRYQITLAVAGFTEEDLNIESNQNNLTVKGEKQQNEEKKFLHRGIATRNFERKFSLAEHVRVVDAKLEHGLLQINLVREIPEVLKPRTIAINTLSSDTDTEAAA